MKDIKIRIRSVQSTMQITKAMELVASSKLRRAKETVERARPYFVTLYNTLSDIAYAEEDFASPFVKEREAKKACYILIAGDRGLAGGYNSNVFKAYTAHSEKLEIPHCVVPIGKKAVDFCERKGIEILTKDYANVEDVSIGDCHQLAHMLASEFVQENFDQIYIVFTQFVSMMTQSPMVMQVLPIPYDKSARNPSKAVTLYEPSASAVFNAIVPEYISGMAYGALSESWASELSARRNAMDSASKNAGEMIDDLSLRYNRARQAAITQEITEIVAGAEH
ncbi:MAG: ATP synthase F1 subunit gamma [Butyricicoccaceae bacterium]